MKEDDPDEQGLEAQLADVDGGESQQDDGEDDVRHHHAEGGTVVVQQQPQDNGDRQYVSFDFLHLILFRAAKLQKYCVPLPPQTNISR